MQTFLWWFIYWKYIIILLALLFFGWMLFNVKLFRVGNIIYWKVKYIIIIFIFLFIIFYMLSDELLGFLIAEFQKKQLSPEKVQLRDPQEYIYLSFEIALFYSFLFIIPLNFLYLWLYLLNFWNKNNQIVGSFYLIIIFYYFFLVKWVVDNDLYLSGWELAWEEERGLYQFQPDLALLNWFYLGEIWDVMIFFTYWIFIFIVYLNNYIIFWDRVKNIFIYKIQLLCSGSIILYSYYLFGGESLFRDIFLIIAILFVQEITYFIILSLSALKFKK